MPLIGEKKFHVINQSKPRLDGIEKVTGKARYAADIYMENMLYAGVLRSPYTSAKVTSIDTTKAKAIAGVEAVITFHDMKKTISWASYRYLTDRICYQGDCVAMVAAKSKSLVEDALEAIAVEYEELPGVYTIEEALEKGAPLVHPEHPGNIFEDSKFHIRKGNIAAGFEQADVVIEREYRTQFVEHSYIEPEAVVAYSNPNDGVMTVHASAQNPFFTRRYVADALGVPMNRVRLVQEILGGTFGGKEEGVGLMAGRAAYLSQVTKRPVKFVFT
ncbi:MAG: molybdopterin cofactor-binding domain-containing protein, partial [Lachnospiraceae bacterium]